MARIVIYVGFSRISLAVAMLAFLSLPFPTSGLAHAGSVIQIGRDDVAIKGYDPVAYFTEGRAVKGSREFRYEWLDATWNFASAKHREFFVADPIKYAPQYGGYCSRSTTVGRVSSADPEIWRIVDGKLYLFYTERTLSRWERDIPGQIADADANWPRVKAELQAQ